MGRQLPARTRRSAGTLGSTAPGRRDCRVPDRMCEAVRQTSAAPRFDDGAAGGRPAPVADSPAQRAETWRLPHGIVSVLPSTLPLNAGSGRHRRLSSLADGSTGSWRVSASHRATQPWNAGQANLGVDTVMDREHGRDRGSRTPDSPGWRLGLGGAAQIRACDGLFGGPTLRLVRGRA